jgi:hypothetical protein
VIVYHRTSETAAVEITRTRRFTSRERGEVCVSDRLFGYANGYGPAATVLDVPEHLLTLDDEFPTGERHYRVRVADIRPEYIRLTYLVTDDLW